MTTSSSRGNAEPVLTSPSRAGAPARPWADPRSPIGDRVTSLLAAMTLEEKLAQLGSVWPGVDSVIGDVAPMQGVLAPNVDFEAATAEGIGHVTRPFGTKPVDPGKGAEQLTARQRDLMRRTRLGIPALAHEECLTGFTTYRASVFPAS
ncbi:glycosyl hydrolase, partial [Streptomyces sp. NPDC051665]